MPSIAAAAVLLSSLAVTVNAVLLGEGITSLEAQEMVMNRWLWICPILAVLISVLALASWGFSWMTALVVGLAIVCPALMLWGSLQAGKKTEGKRK